MMQKRYELQYISTLFNNFGVSTLWRDQSMERCGNVTSMGSTTDQTTKMCPLSPSLSLLFVSLTFFVYDYDG